MQIRIVAVGRVRDPAVGALCAEQLKRLQPYHRVEVVEVRTGSVDEEAAAVLRAVGGGVGEQLWLLERTGEEFASEELAERFERLATGGISRLVFAIAGTYGAGEALWARADVRWSLSRLTFLHEWTRAIVLEQLYRAAKIARKEPYHH
ncbi:MAG: 23S rRNA (pseudouridine(1915)-N(3))-methyltransferase RlmH [Candidatus Eremiobacteraeota bacterium]|nr:23S rRNA (pseudouridine(1915)-N(3))-methyltransferase RlmH [Candidatus Eremiobacteraeota bacterium]